LLISEFCQSVLNAAKRSWQDAAARKSTGGQ